MIGKLKNIKVLNLLYEKKADLVLELALQNPQLVFPLVDQRLEQRLALLQ